MTTIKLRRDTATNWTANNPILATGEPGLETDTKKLKFGDGSTAWNSLSYATNGGGLSGSPAQLTQTLDVNGHNITSSSNGNIAIVPDGSGNIQLTPGSGHVTISSTNFPTDAGYTGQFLSTDGSGNASWASISIPSTFSFPSGAGTNNQLLQSNGDGTTTWVTRTSPIPSQTGNSGKFLTTNGSTTSWASAGGGNNIIIVGPNGDSNQYRLRMYGSNTPGFSSDDFKLYSNGGISGVSLSGYWLTLPAGTYIFNMPMVSIPQGNGHVGLYNNSTSSFINDDNRNSRIRFGQINLNYDGSNQTVSFPATSQFTLASSTQITIAKYIAETRYGGSDEISLFDVGQMTGSVLAFTFIKIA
jgi:hypothetical protein